MQPQQGGGFPLDPNQNIAMGYGQPISQEIYPGQNMNGFSPYPNQYYQNSRQQNLY